MKKKLQLNELNVQSFVTTTITEARGGGNGASDPCSIHQCPSVPADQCATTDNACPTVHVACPTNPVLDCFSIVIAHTFEIKCMINVSNACATNYCTPPQ